MCHHYDREQLTATPPIGAEDVDEEPGDCDSDEDERTIEDRHADAPPAADD